MQADAQSRVESSTGWSDEQLAATVAEAFGLGVDHGLPEAMRFVSSVSKLIRKRRARPDAGNDPASPAVFVLEPNGPVPDIGLETRRVPMLDNGLTRVTGRVWFVGAVAASGRYVDAPTDDDDQLFAFVVDELNLGSIPTIVFDPRTAIVEARYYPVGLCEPDRYRGLPLGERDVSLHDLFTVIDSVHRNCLMTPDALDPVADLWANHDRCYPAKKAEDLVQHHLRVGLVAAFPTFNIRKEQSQAEGRLDLEIESSDPLDGSSVVRHALLELKVLRSFGEKGSRYAPKYTLDWVRKGVEQAYTYRRGREVRASALCCFDMRISDTGDECFDHVKEDAEKLDVVLKRWYIYADSEKYRSAYTASHLTEIDSSVSARSNEPPC